MSARAHKSGDKAPSESSEDMKPKRPHRDERKSLLAQVHIARKELDLEEDDYRDIIEARFGKRSAGKISVPQLRELVGIFMDKGWKPKGSGRSRGRAKSPAVRKIYVLWRLLREAGVVSAQRPDGFAQRMTRNPRRPEGVPRVEWLADADAWAVLEALKAMCRRHGIEVGR